MPSDQLQNLTAPPEPASRSEPRGARLVQLDAIRGITAFWVVLYHFTFQYSRVTGQPVPLKIHGGNQAVNLFFAISGYVIAMSLHRSGSTIQFLAARATRLYPTFWACMALTFLSLRFYSVQTFATPDGLDFLANLTMLPTTLFHRLQIDGVYWTLEIEMRFYLLMAILFVVGLKDKLVPCAIALVSLALLADIGLRLGHPFVPSLAIDLLNLDFIAYFAIGIGAYDLKRTCLRPIHVVLLAMACVEQFLGRIPAGGPYLIVCAVVLGMALSEKFGFFRWKALLFLGGISYPLYLVHRMTGFILIEILRTAGTPIWLAILLAVAAAVIAASLLSFAVERPTMRWLRHMRSRPAREAPVSAS